MASGKILSVDALRVVAIMEELTEKLAYLSVITRQDVLVKRMKTTVEEERAREELLEKYIQQERAASARRAELETQLTVLRTEREKASNRSSETIMKLKADLQDVGDFTDQRLTQLHEQYNKREAEIMRSFEFRIAELRALVTQQQKHNMTFFTRGEEESEGLKTTKKIAVKDLEKVIENYDREMLDREAKIRELKEKNTADEAAVARLQALLQVVEEESERLQQERDLELAREQLAKTQLAVFSKAVCFLQSYWRGILQREEYIQMKRSARGKKNRGKKK
eukprot:XP_023973758.1 trichohyalin-like [Physeter catodon]